MPESLNAPSGTLTKPEWMSWPALHHTGNLQSDATGVAVGVVEGEGVATAGVAWVQAASRMKAMEPKDRTKLENAARKRRVTG
jgi:hypothetical protein